MQLKKGFAHPKLDQTTKAEVFMYQKFFFFLKKNISGPEISCLIARYVSGPDLSNSLRPEVSCSQTSLTGISWLQTLL